MSFWITGKNDSTIKARPLLTINNTTIEVLGYCGKQRFCVWLSNDDAKWLRDQLTSSIENAEKKGEK